MVQEEMIRQYKRGAEDRTVDDDTVGEEKRIG